MKNVIMKFNKLFISVFLIVFFIQPSSALNIVFEYDNTYSTYWTEQTKSQIEGAGKLLSSYISNNHTLKITVTIDPALGSNGTLAYADGAYSKWSSNTTTSSISTEGRVFYNKHKVINQNVIKLTIHELLHCLGITDNAAAFLSKIKKVGTDITFTGTKTKLMNNNNTVLLHNDSSHFKRDNVVYPLGLSPAVRSGGGDILTVFDLAMLEDIGYQIPILSNKTEPFKLGFNMDNPMAWRLASDNSSWQIQGSTGNDVIQASDGKYSLIGYDGDDVLTTGNGVADMYGDEINWGGKIQGKDIYYIKTNYEHIIRGFKSTDSIYISNSVLSQEALNSLKFEDPTDSEDRATKQYYNEWCFGYKLVSGAFKIKFWKTRAVTIESIKSRIVIKNDLLTTNPKNGDVIRADNSPRVYLIENNQRRWIPTQDRLFAKGYSHAMVKVLKPDQVNSIPEGAVFLDGGPKNGDFIRPNDSPKVYFIENGKRRWITTEAILFAKGGSHEGVIVLPPAEVNKLPEGDSITN